MYLFIPERSNETDLFSTRGALLTTKHHHYEILGLCPLGSGGHHGHHASLLPSNFSKDVWSFTTTSTTAEAAAAAA
jgi:hypothetical protein